MKKTRFVVATVATVLALAACSVDETDKTHSVRFDVAGYADDIAAVTKQDGDIFTEAELPTPMSVKDGYRFEAWYADANYTKPFVDFEVKSDTILHAKFVSLLQTTTKYSVKFDVAGLATFMNGNEQTSSFSVPKDRGELFTENDLPKLNVAEGYDLLGWYKDVMCTEVFRAFEVTDHITLYANFTSPNGKSLKVISYETKYSYKDTLCTIADELPSSCLNVPPASMEDDFYFRGWYTSVADNAERAVPGMKIEGNNITLYAKWEKITANASVTFEGLKFSDINYVYAQNGKDSITNEKKYEMLQSTNINGNTNYYLIPGVSEIGTDGAKALVFCKSMGGAVLRSDKGTDEIKVAVLRLGGGLNSSNSTAVDTLISYVQVHPTRAGMLKAMLVNVPGSSVVEESKAQALFIDETGNVLASVPINNKKDTPTEAVSLSCEVTRPGPVYLALGRYGDVNGQLDIKSIMFTAK